MSRKIVLISLILILATFLPLFFVDVYADVGMIASTDKLSYKTGELLFFSGEVEEKRMPVLALRVYDPNGIILSANNVEISEDNSFSKMISLDSPFYDEAGTYTIKIDYGQLEKEITFDVNFDNSIGSIIEEPVIPELTSLVTDKQVYTDNDTITITGQVSSIDESSVLIGIHDPFGIPTGFYFGDVNSDKKFSVNFLVKAGVNFKIEGTYYAIGYYGDSDQIAYFDFFESIDEVESPKNELFEDEIEKSEESDIEHYDTNNIHDEIIVEEIDQNKNLIDNTINEPKTKPQEKTDKKETSTDILKEKVTVKANNLSVEDIELGKLLNQITLNCDQNEYTDTVSYYDGMGPALIRLCEYSNAITYFDNDIADDPNNPEILTNKGVALAKLGHFEEAILYYDSALENESSYVPALNNKGNALSQLGKFDEAKSAYNLGLAFNPENKILKENFEKSNQMTNLTSESHDEILSNYPTSQTNNEMNNEIEIKDTTNSDSTSLFEQIGSFFSLFGTFFGF